MFRVGYNYGRRNTIYCGIRRRMSSSDPAPTVSGFTRTKNLFLENRQGIVNTIGMAYVVYYALYNTQLQKAWEARDVEMAALEEELEHYKGGLTDEAWLKDVDEKIKSGGSMRKELATKFRHLFSGDATGFTSVGGSDSSGKML